MTLKKWIFLAVIGLAFMAWVWRAVPFAVQNDAAKLTSGGRAAKITLVRARGPVDSITSSPALQSSPQVSPTVQMDAEKKGEAKQAIARAVCNSEILGAFSEPGACEQDVLVFRDVMERRIEKLKTDGIQLDRERCVATDSNGDSSDLDSMPGALLGMADLMVTHASGSSFEESYGKRAFGRLNLVAVCSVMKVMDYWEENPDEIPPSDSIQSHLYFDVQKRKPVDSFFTGAFLRVLREWKKI